MRKPLYLLMFLTIISISLNVQALTKPEVKRISDRLMTLFPEDIEYFKNFHGDRLYRQQTPYEFKFDLDFIWKGKALYAATFAHGRIYISGEWFRKKLIKEFGTVFILCHEMGHHFGGYPFGPFETNEGWISTEGQSDYYAGAICLKKYYEKYKSSYAELKKDLIISPYIKDQCQESYQDKKKVELCAVLAQRNFDLFQVLADIRNKNEQISIELNNATEHERIYEGHFNRHPLPQCRYETVLSGLLCNTDVDSYNFAKSFEKDQFCQKNRSPGHRPNCWYDSGLPYRKKDSQRRFEFKKPDVVNYGDLL